MKKYEMDLTNGRLVTQVIRYSIPVVLAGLLQLAFNAADLIVVGQFAGDGSVGAVGATGSITSLIINLFIGLSIGACSVVARYIGEGDKQSANRAAHTSIVVAFISGIVVGALGFLLSRTFLEMMDTPHDLIDRSTMYMKIYFIGVPANLLYNFGSSIMRATGDTKRPLYYLTAAGVLNVILNLIFVIVLKLGVAGVAIATIVSQFVSAVLVLRALFVTEGTCKLSLSKLRIHKRELTLILCIGLPAGLQSVLFAASRVIIQSAINSFGAIATDGDAASANLESFIYNAMHSVSQSALAFVSQNAGAKKKKRILHSMFSCMGLASILGIVMGAVMYIFRYPLLHLYLGADSPAVEFGEKRATIFFLTHFICAFMDTLSSSLRGLGKSMSPMIITLIGSCVLRIGWVYTVFTAFPTLECLYISYPVSWMTTSLALGICFFIVYRRFLLSCKTDMMLLKEKQGA